MKEVEPVFSYTETNIMEKREMEKLGSNQISLTCTRDRIISITGGFVCLTIAGFYRI